MPETKRNVLRLRVLTAALLWLAASFGLSAQVTVTASVDEATVGTEELVRYTIEIRGVPPSDVETPRPPETEGLSLTQPNPMTSQSVSYVNGEVSQSIGFQWRFRPLAEGTATIGRASVVVQGKAYSTEPISVEIVQQAQRPRAGQRRHPLEDLLTDDTRDYEAREIGERDLFIRVRPSARTVYQNQQITIAYDLYFREGIQLRGSRLADSWDAEGFWREDLEMDAQPQVRDEVVDGLRYRVVTLKRVAAFPTRPGELTIEPLRIETEAAIPLRSRSLFSPFFGPARFQSATVSSPALTITSRPLPPDPPAEFTGAVGSFDLSVEADRNDVELGEPIRLVVRLSGRGNLATISAPELESPSFLDVYDPEITNAINRKQNLVSGSKTFTFVIVPSTPGAHTIPPVRMAYFDPSAGRYVRLVSEPIAIAVRPGDAVAGRPTVINNLPVNDIAALLPASAGSWLRRDRGTLHDRTWPYALIAAPVLLLLGLFGVRRYRDHMAANVGYARSRRAHPVARKHLKAAERLLAAGESRDFYQEVSRAVQSFVGNRLNVAVQGLTIPQLERRLAEHAVSPETLAEFRALLSECDRALFAPVPPDKSQMETATERAATLIAALDEALPRARSNRNA